MYVLRTTFYWLAAWIANGKKGVSELPGYLLLVCGLGWPLEKRGVQTTGLLTIGLQSGIGEASVWSVEGKSNYKNRKLTFFV